MTGAYDLDRFTAAQAPVYQRVCDELRAGQKRSHWMWFVFPQIAGLGRSAMAAKYAIASRDEAAAYLAHPVLGARLRQCAALVEAAEGRTAHQIFGSPDDLKLHSSMTLFAAVAEPDSVFHRVLAKYFGGQPDDATLLRL